MIANCAALEVGPGSMGLPLPGIEAAIVGRHADGTVAEVGPDTEGEFALQPGWPSMFRHLSEPARDAQRISAIQAQVDAYWSAIP